ncbi:response regulator transcription factor [Nonomuraea sp. NPDC048826]|uniref:helix-turn-helix transcriptional regulator n=1 Tax=Nonomuraea sp. NPDC048826 TaxID=3364347 RepID=UPI003723108F
MALLPQDYERILGLAVELVGGTAPELDWPCLTAELNDALGGAVCVFLDGVRPRGRAGRILARAPVLASPDQDTLVSRAVGDHPLALYYAAHADRRPLAITDVTTTGRWRRTAAHAVLRAELGVDEQLALPMGGARAFLVGRAPGERIGGRDLAYACRVQPLLLAADRHLRQLRRWRDAFGPSPGGRDDPAERARRLGVTGRELAVLTLLADGLTATAMGHRLGISPRTVAKHQQNLYRKLDVADRVTAVLRGQGTGLLPVPARR